MTTDRKNKMEFKTFIRKKPTAFDKEAALKKNDRYIRTRVFQSYC